MTFTGTLRPYQRDPVERMKVRKRMLLAAEQGTGKTTMAINVIEDLFDDGTITEPGLVIALGSLTRQWADKIEEFTGGSSIALVIPSGSDSTLDERIALYQSAHGADYIILSYDAVINDWEHVRRLPRGFVVADEVSVLRGFSSNRSRLMKVLTADVPVVLGLSGTPIENGKPEEAFSVMEVVDPSVFGKFHLFDRAFIKRNTKGWVTGYRNLPTFHSCLSEAMVRLRVDDPEVAPYMPSARDGSPIFVPWDAKSWELYRHVSSELLSDLDQAARWGHNFDLATHYGRSKKSPTATDRMRGRIGQKLQTLLMLCDHPDLLRRSADKYRRSAGKSAQGGSAYIAQIVDQGLLDGVVATPKLDRAVDWVWERIGDDEDTKVVVFMRFVDMIELFAERLDALDGGLWRPYSGRMTARKKDANLKEFQTDPHVRVLLASDAGGFGLDIPQAQYLLNYDLPDGAGAADQRDTRIVRTSSKYPWVSRNWILMANSIEERNLARLDQKRAVARAFIDGRGADRRGGMDLSVRTLTTFLRESLAAGMGPR